MTIKINPLLGCHGKDKITKFEGVITGFAQYITGCDQYLVQPECKDGAHVEGRWFDDNRLQVSLTPIITIDVDEEKPGACGEAPIR